MQRLQGMRFRGFLIIVVLLGVFVSMPAVAESRTSQGAEAALEVQRARSSGGTYLVEIRSAEPIPLNEIFSLEFRVFDASTPKKPVENARITLSIWGNRKFRLRSGSKSEYDR